MPLTVKHAFVSAKVDGADPTKTQPSHWNADHTIAGFDAAVDDRIAAPGILRLKTKADAIAAIIPNAVDFIQTIIAAGGEVDHAIWGRITSGLPDFTAADNTQWKRIKSDIVSLKEYSPNADGTTADTAKINAGISETAAANGVLVIPPKLYLAEGSSTPSKHVLITDYCKVFAYGARFKRSGTTGGVQGLIQQATLTTPIESPYWRGGRVDGNWSAGVNQGGLLSFNANDGDFADLIGHNWGVGRFVSFCGKNNRIIRLFCFDPRSVDPLDTAGVGGIREFKGENNIVAFCGGKAADDFFQSVPSLDGDFGGGDCFGGGFYYCTGESTRLIAAIANTNDPGGMSGSVVNKTWRGIRGKSSYESIAVQNENSTGIVDAILLDDVVIDATNDTLDQSVLIEGKNGNRVGTVTARSVHIINPKNTGLRVRGTVASWKQYDCDWGKPQTSGKSAVDIACQSGASINCKWTANGGHGGDFNGANNFHAGGNRVYDVPNAKAAFLLGTTAATDRFMADEDNQAFRATGATTSVGVTVGSLTTNALIENNDLDQVDTPISQHTSSLNAGNVIRNNKGDLEAEFDTPSATTVAYKHGKASYRISGAVTITGFASPAAGSGTPRVLWKFASNPLVQTGSGSLRLNGDFQASAGAALLLEWDLTDSCWYEIARSAPNGLSMRLATVKPSTPATGAALFALEEVGRIVAAWIDPLGAVVPVQPHMASSNWGANVASGSGAPSNDGMAYTAVGGGTSRAPATTNRFTMAKRDGYVSAATAGSSAEHRATYAHYSRGNAAGIGGFYCAIKFGFQTVVASGRCFIGMTSGAAAFGNVDPSTLFNLVGVGCDSGQTTLRLMNNDAGGVATSLNLGADYPFATSTFVYKLELYCAPNDTVIYYRLEKIGSGIAPVSGSLSTNLPTTTSFLGPRIWINNGTTASVTSMDLISMYCSAPEI